MRKNDKKEIEIDYDDIQFIMQNDIIHFQELLNNCFCSHCKDSITTMINYKAYLNSLNDIRLNGQCIRCKNMVSRHIETGEQREKYDAAEHLRLIKDEIKTKSS